MDRALFAAASGMSAQQRNLETIADNLANAGVVGFKGSAQSFAELVAPGEGGVGTVSLGARVVFAQGKLARSPGPFDLAIDGPGFFTVLDAHGRHYYTRDGEFSRAADGTLRNAHDLRLAGVKIPTDALSATVEADGSVRATFAKGQRVVGQIRLAEFLAPERLRVRDGSSFEATRGVGASSNRRTRRRRRSETAFRDARRVERHDHRRDDADPDRATRLRGERKRRSSRR